MSEYDQGWNAAIRAAEQAVRGVPLIAKKDRGTPAEAKAQRIMEALLALRRS